MNKLTKYISKDILKKHISNHDSVCIVNTSNIVNNYYHIKDFVNDDNVIVAPVLKNNAYGLGIPTVGKALFEKSDCNNFFVATLDEAIRLRKISNTCNIYVLHGIIKNRINEYIEYNLTPVLSVYSQIVLWVDLAKKVKKLLNAIFHIETGMNRFALSEEEIINIKKNKLDEKLNLKYIMSHMACADMEGHFSQEMQYNNFIKLTEQYFPNIKRSLSASNATFLGKKYHFDMVRPGIAMYGSNATDKTKNTMNQVIYLYTSIKQIKHIKKGEHIGYGFRWKAEKDTDVALVTIGYGDGVIRSASNKGVAYIKDNKIPILGTISMDLISLDLTSLPDSLKKEGQLVELIGDNIDIATLANAGNTVHCEIISLLTDRYPRIEI